MDSVVVVEPLEPQWNSGEGDGAGVAGIDNSLAELKNRIFAEQQALAARQLDQILKTVPPGEKELVSAAMACRCVTAQRHTIGLDKAHTVLKSLSEHLDGEVVRVERARDEHALRWGGRQGGAR